MDEIIERRGYNRKVFLRDDGKFVSRVHAGHVHYLNAGALTDVDIQWQDGGSFWVMTTASYRMRVAKDFSASALLEYQNRFNGMTQTVRFDPRSLVWVDGRDFAGATTFRTQQTSPATLVSPSVLRFTDAFGAGIHFEITLQRSGFRKEIVIDSRAAMGAAPSANHHLALTLRYDDGDLQIVSGSEVWDRVGIFERTRYSIVEPAGSSTIHPACAQDAAERQRDIPTLFMRRQGVLWQAKVLPRNVIEQATYPLRADTTTSFFAGAGDGWTAGAANATWATARAGAGTSADYVGTISECRAVLSTGLYRVFRGFFPIDTSGLPDGDAISAATLYLYPTIKTNTDDDGNDFTVVVGPTTQADPTQLAAADFEECGPVDAPTELSNRIDLGDITAGVGYVGWVLNASGLAAISKTGYTLLGFRAGHDILDDPPAGNNRLVCSSSEDATGTQDPYLEVVHASAAVGHPWHYYAQQ
jgi:hypothetical protein